MKILVEGKPKQKICPNCQCIFEYDSSDIEYIAGMTLLNRGMNTVRCPMCNERIHEKYSVIVDNLGRPKY